MPIKPAASGGGYGYDEYMVEVKGMNMVEDITTEMVKREHESVVTGGAM
jgi:hypothetical protein